MIELYHHGLSRREGSASSSPRTYGAELAGSPRDARDNMTCGEAADHGDAPRGRVDLAGDRAIEGGSVAEPDQPVPRTPHALIPA